MSEKNYVKQEIYANMKENLKKAMKAGFYYEAIFIEYAIIEDRCASLLKHADVRYVEKDGKEITIKQKLSKLKSNPAFVSPYVRKRLPIEFIQRMTDWKEERNRLIHALTKIPYDNKAIKRTADEGQEIARILDNSAKSINNYFKKLKENETSSFTLKSTASR